MDARTPDRHVLYWETVAAIPLPAGWRNVYRMEEDGTLAVSPSPAMLVQEHRETVACWDEPGAPGVQTRTTRHDPPYEVRVVFADHEGGSLYAANELGNFLGVIGPGEEPDDAGFR